MFPSTDSAKNAVDMFPTTDKSKDIHSILSSQAVADCQMNLFDSHDVMRVHNYKEISFERYRGVVISYLMFTGIPCIYYGDEVGIDGHTESDVGCRYPMPWGKEGAERDKFFSLYKRMIELRRNVPAFAKGGRKVLFDEGRILAVARFWGSEKYVGIISREDAEKEISLPLWQIGASKATSDKDEFGTTFTAASENGELLLKVPADAALIIKVD